MPPGHREGSAELLSITEVAAALQVGEVVVRRLIAAGDLSFMKESSGRYLTERLMLERWIRTQYQVTAAFVADHRFAFRARDTQRSFADLAMADKDPGLRRCMT